jgi:arylsulfatase
VKAKYIIPVVVVVAVAAVLLWFFRPFGDERPSIILISVDTLRPDHLGCYGYDRDTSPAVDEFARESMLFEWCFSQAPTTRPSCGTMVSGYFPHELKIFNNSDNLPLPVTTVAERLRENGYRTIGVVSNFVLRKGGGFEQGFDYYDDKMDQVELVRGIPERIAEKTTDTAISLLRLHSRDKLFMWIHYQDPHGPYTPRPPYETMFITRSGEQMELSINETVSGKGGIPSYQKLNGFRDYGHYVAQYDGEIRYFDEHFGRLLGELKALGLYDNALIIFTSDHGEGMGEHDYYFAHGEYVYNSLVRVPLIIRFQSGRAGRREDHAQLADVVPTILGAAGVKADAVYHGRNLLEGSSGRRSIFSEMPGKYAVIRGNLKLVHHAQVHKYFLFDIGEDPDESRNLLSDSAYAGSMKPLASALSRFRQENVLRGRVHRNTQRLTEDEREKLKALGYVQ